MMNIVQKKLYAKATLRLMRTFGKFSSRTTTPRVIKDNKFTRTGYYKPKKSRQKQYDLEGVTNAHLFYDHKVDNPIARKRYKQNLKNRRKEHDITVEGFDQVIEDLTNLNLVQRGSYKLILRIQQLERLYPKRRNEWLRAVNYTLKNAFDGHFVQYKLTYLAPLMFYAGRYATLDQTTFKNLANWILGLFRNAAYQETYISENEMVLRRYLTLVKSLEAVYLRGLKGNSEADQVYDQVMSGIYESVVESDQIDSFLDNLQFLTFLDIVTRVPSVNSLSEEVVSSFKTAFSQKTTPEILSRVRSIDSKFKVLEERDLKKIYHQALGQSSKKFKRVVEAWTAVDLVDKILEYNDLIEDKGVQNRIKGVIANIVDFTQTRRPLDLDSLFITHRASSQFDLPEDVSQNLASSINKGLESAGKISADQIVPFLIFSRQQNQEPTPQVSQSIVDLLRQPSVNLSANQCQAALNALTAFPALHIEELKYEFNMKIGNF